MSSIEGHFAAARKEVLARAKSATMKPYGADHPYRKIGSNHVPAMPEVLDLREVLSLEAPKPEALIERVIPASGASLLLGSQKAGKTILAVQHAIATVTGAALFETYRVKQPGAAMIIEQDDPSGAISIRDIVACAQVDRDLPFYVVPRVPFTFGSAFLAWLEREIKDRGLSLVVLDSYTALRPSRERGADIVKVEQTELRQLDELAKSAGCAFEILHHSSKGSAGLHWSDQGAGTYAMGAATEAQIHISRFADLPGGSPERLVRIRGRHLEETEMVLRFRHNTLDYEHVMEGGASPEYPIIKQIQRSFGDATFSPKDLYWETGMSRATASRVIARLLYTGALSRSGHGAYQLGDLR